MLAAAACVALVAGLLLQTPWQSRRPAPASTGDSGLGVPDHLYAVPGWLSDQDNGGAWLRKEVSTSLVTGTAAAAFLTPGGLPVVVDATSGTYHLLALPDIVTQDTLVRTGADAAPLALPPGGRYLAWGWGEPGGPGHVATSGVRIVDLTKGTVTQWRLSSQTRSVLPAAISWSPDGQWLVWSGHEMRQWDTSGLALGSPVAGRLHLSEPGRTMGVRQHAADGFDWAIDNDGTTVRGRGSVLREQALDYQLTDVAGSLPRVTMNGRFAGYLQVLGETNEVLAILPGDGTIVLQHMPGGGGQVVRVSDNTTDDPITVDPGIETLSLATDLLYRAAPITRPAPHWPWSPDRWVETALGGGITVLVLVVVLYRLRRSPSRRGTRA